MTTCCIHHLPGQDKCPNEASPGRLTINATDPVTDAVRATVLIPLCSKHKHAFTFEVLDLMKEPQTIGPIHVSMGEYMKTRPRGTTVLTCGCGIRWDESHNRGQHSLLLVCDTHGPTAIDHIR